MRRKRSAAPRITPDRAAQVLSMLIEAGKIGAQDVARALARRRQLIRDLKARLAAMEEGARLSGSPGPRASTRRRRRVRGRSVRRRVSRISRAQRAARQAQGRYLGAIRQLPARARAKVRVIREKSGVRAAIAEAKRMSRHPVKRTKRPATRARRATKRRPAKRRPEKAKKTQSSPASRNETVPAAETTK
jgi:hypothetical protein